MHRALKTAVRPGAFDARPALRVRLASIPIGYAQIVNGWPVWRFGADLFAINGESGTHDIVSAASVISGAGNPLPEAN